MIWGAISRILSSRVGLVGVALIAAFGWHLIDKRQAVKAAWDAGYEARSAEAQAELDTVAESVRQKEIERLAAVEQSERLQKELDREAINDPNADRMSLGADSVRRLKQAR